jgi:hypothetical protein
VKPVTKRTRNSPGNRPIRKGEFDDGLISERDCRDLWAAKLLAYLRDALQSKRKGDSLPPSVAQAWFGTFDFHVTCWCANVEPEQVMRTYKKRLAHAQAGRWDEALEGLVAKGKGKQ